MQHTYTHTHTLHRRDDGMKGQTPDRQRIPPSIKPEVPLRRFHYLTGKDGRAGNATEFFGIILTRTNDGRTTKLSVFSRRPAIWWQKGLTHPGSDENERILAWRMPAMFPPLDWPRWCCCMHWELGRTSTPTATQKFFSGTRIYPAACTYPINSTKRYHVCTP